MKTGTRALLARPWVRGVGAAVAILALLLVFMAYRDPHTVLDLANRVWACL